MIPAFVTPFQPLLRRITFICGACIILSGCMELSRKNAEIHLRADTNDTTYIRFDCNRVYDTIGASFSLHIQNRNANGLHDVPLQLYLNGKLVKAISGSTGFVDFGWIAPGNYTLTAGQPNKYPYFIITDIIVLSGHGCELNLRFPSTQ